MLQHAFRGKDPYIVVCAHVAHMVGVNNTVHALTEHLPNAARITLVLLEDVKDDPDVFLNRALAMKDNISVNPAVLQLADRPLVSKGQKKQYAVWVVHTTVASRTTRTQPRYKQIRISGPTRGKHRSPKH